MKAIPCLLSKVRWWKEDVDYRRKAAQCTSGKDEQGLGFRILSNCAIPLDKTHIFSISSR